MDYNRRRCAAVMRNRGADTIKCATARDGRPGAPGTQPPELTGAVGGHEILSGGDVLALAEESRYETWCVCISASCEISVTERLP